MIVVFVAHTHPPLVFETTPCLLVAHATDSAASTGTLPPPGMGLDFESAWNVLTQDLRSAHHFQDIAAARAYFEAHDELPLHTRTQIVSSLDRLTRPARKVG